MDDTEKVAEAREWAPYVEGPPTIIRLGSHAKNLPWPREVVAEAIAQFCEALKIGRIKLRGIRFETGEVEIVPLSDIRECDFKKGELRERGRRLPRFTNLEVDLAEIRRVFADEPSMIDVTSAPVPAAAEVAHAICALPIEDPPPAKAAEAVGKTVADDAAADAYTYKTGAPGRPTAMDFIMDEALRRHNAGSAKPGLNEEATELNKWCKGTHRKIAAPTVKTIENKFRGCRKAWDRSGSNPHN